ncbi:MAG: hypothetical protein WDN06_14455 [Asticcacaulis sp.]
MLRKTDPFYQLVEQHYVEGRISEAEYKGLVQKHLDGMAIS